MLALGSIRLVLYCGQRSWYGKNSIERRCKLAVCVVILLSRFLRDDPSFTKTARLLEFAVKLPREFRFTVCIDFVAFSRQSQITPELEFGKERNVRNLFVGTRFRNNALLVGRLLIVVVCFSTTSNAQQPTSWSKETRG